mmetsp:Transcript_24663/g.62437  ORF Transcript_24663/g.62437 Transcript_24663/m.62437 type:complete len:108 (+) Transcript_24663:666-989(+)
MPRTIAFGFCVTALIPNLVAVLLMWTPPARRERVRDCRMAGILEEHHPSSDCGRNREEPRDTSVEAACGAADGATSEGATKPDTPGKATHIASHRGGRWRNAAILLP